MSDITVGSVWLEINENNEIYTVKNIALNPDDGLVYVVLDKMFEGWSIFSKKDFLRKFKPRLDMVNNPPHYKDASGIECIEVTKHMQFCGGNCFKYLYRAGQKGDAVEDLKKAAWYAERAWIMSEVLNKEAMDGVRLVAKHRTGNIAQAMNFLAEDFWGMVEMRIKSEITRLENE